MRRMMFGTLVLMMILTLAPFAGLSTGEAAGPWKARIVDAETGQPIEGVVVLAVWIRYTASPGGWAGAKYYGSEEVLTGPDGRFVIPQRTIINWLPLLTEIRGPEFKIFKPGYGAWGIRGWKGERPKEWEDLTVGEILTRDGIVVEIPPLKTREERLRFHDSFIRPTGLVPLDRMKNLNEAWEQDRKYLGFGK